MSNHSIAPVKKWLIVWVGAFPAAVLVNFIRFNVNGAARALCGIVGMMLVAYVLFGWIPVLVVGSRRKGKV